MVAGQNICQHLFIGVTDVRRTIGVINRSGNVESVGHKAETQCAGSRRGWQHEGTKSESQNPATHGEGFWENLGVEISKSEYRNPKSETNLKEWNLENRERTPPLRFPLLLTFRG